MSNARNDIESEWILPPLLDAWFLTGPTAGGKSSIAIPLAKQLNAEILSLDSMAVYRDMNIGTAKPSLEDRQTIAHHLIDLVPPTEPFSLSQYVRLSHQAAQDVRQRGKTPLFVGGTPLYLKALLRGLFLGPDADPEFRAAVEADVQVYGIEALHDRLRQVDPLAAHRILPGDLRRMTRALEVAKITGRPLSHWQTQFERARPAHQLRVFALHWERPIIHQRVNARVDAMFDQGLVAEVQQLLDTYGAFGPTAAQAVGYKEVCEHLRSQSPLSETVEVVKAHTRQFVRRQEIWFRSLSELRRVAIAPNFVPEHLAREIWEAGREIENGRKMA